MRVTVRLFAGLRERAGKSRLELEDVARVADVWPALGLDEEPQGLLYAVNREYVERGHELSDGDEVALIPPVSGGSFTLVEGPLDVAAALHEVETPRRGRSQVSSAPSAVARAGARSSTSSTRPSRRWRSRCSSGSATS